MSRPRFEVRAVWYHAEHGHMVSQPAEEFDREPMSDAPPNHWSVYEVLDGVVKDHDERTAAETHANNLNGITK